MEFQEKISWGVIGVIIGIGYLIDCLVWGEGTLLLPFIPFVSLYLFDAVEDTELELAGGSVEYYFLGNSDFFLYWVFVVLFLFSLLAPLIWWKKLGFTLFLPSLSYLVFFCILSADSIIEGSYSFPIFFWGVVDFAVASTYGVIFLLAIIPGIGIRETFYYIRYHYFTEDEIEQPMLDYLGRRRYERRIVNNGGT